MAGLVNNAAVTGRVARIDEQEAEDLDRLFAVNVIGTMLCAREAVRRLSTRYGGPGGAIVNISSVAARLGGLAGAVPYAATKGAIETFTRGLAAEVAREGIRVNAVAPGMTATDMPSKAMQETALPPAFRLAGSQTLRTSPKASSWLMSSPAAALRDRHDPHRLRWTLTPIGCASSVALINPKPFTFARWRCAEAWRGDGSMRASIASTQRSTTTAARENTARSARVTFQVGLNPYGPEPMRSVCKARGGPRASAKGRGLEGFLDIARELGAKTLENFRDPGWRALAMANSPRCADA